MIRLGAVAAIITGICVTSRARADDSPKLDDLETLLSEPMVYTTSAPIASTATDAPGLTTVITALDLKRYGIFSLAEAINFLSLGMATSNLINSATVGARGVVLPKDNVDHVLILLNGRPEPVSIRYPGGIAMEIVDHIEVTLGPGSVLYGSGAMTGVINIVLKRAQDFPGIRVGVEGDIPTSIRPWAGVGYQFKLFKMDAEITSQLQYYRKQGPKLTYGTENLGNDPIGELYRFTTASQGTGIWGGIDSQNAYQSGTAIVKLQAGNLELYGRAVIDGASNEGYPADFNNPNNRLDTQTVSFGARHRFTLSPIVQVAGRLFGVYNAQQVQLTESDLSITQLSSPLSYIFFARQQSNYGDLELQTFLDWLKDGRVVTLAGFEGRVNYADQKYHSSTLNSANNVVLSSTPEAFSIHKYNYTLSPYVQQTWTITNWVSINAGLRMDATNQFPIALSPRVAIAFIPWKTGTIKVSYSRAFRAPTLLESGQSGLALTLDPPQTSPKPSLSAETVSSFEASLEHKWGTHRWVFGAFQSSWSNLIELLPANLGAQGLALQTFHNIASISNMGFQGGARGTFFSGKLSYAFNVTGAIARSSQTGSAIHPLDEAPRLFGNARVAYDLPTGWPTIALAAHFMSPRPVDNAFIGGFSPTPYSPPQLTLRTAVTGFVPKVRGLGYRVVASYTAGRYDPFLVGPVIIAQPGFTQPLLLPVPAFSASIGLSYEH